MWVIRANREMTFSRPILRFKNEFNCRRSRLSVQVGIIKWPISWLLLCGLRMSLTKNMSKFSGSALQALRATLDCDFLSKAIGGRQNGFYCHERKKSYTFAIYLVSLSPPFSDIFPASPSHKKESKKIAGRKSSAFRRLRRKKGFFPISWVRRLGHCWHRAL